MFFNPLNWKLVYITLKKSVRSSNKTQHFTITKINPSLLFKNIRCLFSEKCKPHKYSTQKLLTDKAGGTCMYIPLGFKYLISISLVTTIKNEYTGGLNERETGDVRENLFSSIILVDVYHVSTLIHSLKAVKLL
jgi:hypothetical protein